MNKYPQGVRAFMPRENAPDFIVSEIIITPDELIKYMDSNPDMCSEYNGARQLKVQILKGKDGKSHSVQVNTFKPTKKKDDLPF